MGKFLFLISIFVLIFGYASADILLPNGQAPVGMQYDINSYNIGNRLGVVNASDVAGINRLASEGGYNVVTIDISAKFIWTKYSANFEHPEVDFNFDAQDAFCAYAYSKGMFCSTQMVIDGTGYYNLGSYTFLDTNFSLTKTKYQNNYPSISPSFTTDNNEISIWDLDINTIYFYANRALANHYAGNPAVAIYLPSPNEGFSSRLSPEDSADQNYYWQMIYLPTIYVDINALNLAYGSSYGGVGTDFNAVPIPFDRTNYSVTHQLDWWNMKTLRASILHKEVVRALKEPDSSKKVMSVKLLPDYLYPSGVGSVGYAKSLDTNVYVSYAAPYIDAVSCDIYPDRTTLRGQATVTDIRLAKCKALGDSIGKPVYLGELFPTVELIVTPKTDTNYFTQLTGQVLAYVGDDINSGVRGYSNFCWDCIQPSLHIKDTAKETFLSQMNGSIKSILKNSTNASTGSLAICDNTNVNVALNLDYWRVEPLIGFIEFFRRNDNNAIKFYLNNDCKNATEKVMYANQINIKTSELIDLNTWTAAGGTLISGYRFADGNEYVRSNSGGINTRTALANYLCGTTAANMQGNQLFDVNVNSTETIFGTLNYPNLIFSCRVGAADRNCDYEQSSTGAGAVKEAVQSVTAGAAITSRAVGTGKSIHFGFNLNSATVTTGKNSEDTNMNQAFRDIMTTGGKKLPSTSSYTNYFVWTNPTYTVINSFGATSGTYTLPTQSTIYTIDNNDINTSIGTSLTLGITSGQLIMAGGVSTPSFDHVANSGVWKNVDFNLIFANVNFGGVKQDANYSLDGGASTALSNIIDSNYFVEINTDGNHRVDYNFSNTAGQSLVGTVYALRDATPPTTTYTLTPPGIGQNIILTCIDRTTSNCAQTYYSYDGITYNLYTTPFQIINTTSGLNIYYYSIDDQNNIESPQGIRIIGGNAQTTESCHNIISIFSSNILYLAILIMAIIGGIILTIIIAFNGKGNKETFSEEGVSNIMEKIITIAVVVILIGLVTIIGIGLVSSVC